MACILLWSSAVRVHDSQAHRKVDVTKECIITQIFFCFAQAPEVLPNIGCLACYQNRRFTLSGHPCPTLTYQNPLNRINVTDLPEMRLNCNKFTVHHYRVIFASHKRRKSYHTLAVETDIGLDDSHFLDNQVQYHPPLNKPCGHWHRRTL